MLLEPCHAEDHISNNKGNCMALLPSDTIGHLYYLLYDCSSAQQFTIGPSDRRRRQFLDLAPSRLDCL